MNNKFTSTDLLKLFNEAEGFSVYEHRIVSLQNILRGCINQKSDIYKRMLFYIEEMNDLDFEIWINPANNLCYGGCTNHSKICNCDGQCIFYIDSAETSCTWLRSILFNKVFKTRQHFIDFLRNMITANEKE